MSIQILVLCGARRYKQIGVERAGDDICCELWRVRGDNGSIIAEVVNRKVVSLDGCDDIVRLVEEGVISRNNDLRLRVCRRAHHRQSAGNSQGQLFHSAVRHVFLLTLLKAEGRTPTRRSRDWRQADSAG